MVEVIVPTLGTKSHLTDPSIIIVYILNQYASAPKNSTENWIDETISLSYTLAKYINTNYEALSMAIINDLTKVYNKIFDEGSIVTLNKTVNDDGSLTLNINVSVIKNGETYTASKYVTTDSSGHLSITEHVVSEDIFDA